MQTIQSPSLAEQVAQLPSEGHSRNRQIHRVVDQYAADEAAAALQTAATRMPADGGIAADALRAADALLSRRSRAEEASRDALSTPPFLSLLPLWIRELRDVASVRPETGACTVATALELWSWTMNYFLTGEGARLEPSGLVVDELAESLAPLVAARAFVVEVLPERLESGQLRSDLCRVYAARAAAATGASCAELVFGYRRHLLWDSEGCATCWDGDELDELEALMPGIASGARMSSDVIESDGAHPPKAGPCVRFDGVDGFTRLRHRLDGCLTGARIARDRAAAALLRAATTEGTLR